MPRKREPARLHFRADTGTWIIKDGSKRIGTGCAHGEVERAEQALRAYVAEKYQPVRGGRAAQVTVGDVLIVYLDEKSDATSRPKETEAAIRRVNAFLGAQPLSEIRGKACRDFADHRQTESGARRDLEVLRAAINGDRRHRAADRRGRSQGIVLTCRNSPNLPMARSSSPANAASIAATTAGGCWPARVTSRCRIYSPGLPGPRAVRR